MKTKITLIIIQILMLSGLKYEGFGQAVNVQDSLALVDLYNNTNGPRWNVDFNWLKGPVDTWYGISVANSRVTAILLDFNNLNGVLPTSIGNLTALDTLILNVNYIHGSLPETIGNLENLRILDLYTNRLTGSIPETIGDIKALDFLELSYNSLSGNIPSSIGNLTNLSRLRISANKLTGSIPVSIANLKNITDIELNENKLSGNLPDEIGSLPNLAFLVLYSNNFTGKIPPAFGNLANLENLNLHFNHFTGHIPATFKKLKKLNFLKVSFNNLGSDSNVCYPVKLEKNSYIDVSYNHYTFDGMECLGNSIYYSYYDHQDSISIHQAGSLLSVSAGGTLKNNTYTWYKKGTTNPIAIKQGDSTFVPSNAGLYYAKITNALAVFLTLNTHVYSYNNPGLNNKIHAFINNNNIQSVNSNVTIYPNPAVNKLKILLKGIFDVTINDATGRLLQTKTIMNNGEIDVSNYTAGLYYLRINKTGETKKFVIANR